MKTFLLLALLCAASLSVFATDVTISSGTTSQIPFNPRDIGSDRTYTVTFTNGSVTAMVSPALPSALVGKGGYRIGFGAVDPVGGTGLLPVAGTPNTTTITLTVPYSGTSGAQTVTLYKYVLFRLGVNSAFRPLGSGETIQASNVKDGFFYQEYVISIVNTGGGNVAIFPTMILPATADSPTNTAAKYSAAFFRPDGSFIVYYSCSNGLTSFSLPVATPTTWGAICDYNITPVVAGPATAYTTAQTDAQNPPCTAGKLSGYTLTGNVKACINIGSGLVLDTGTATLSAPGGGGGGGGGNILSLNGLTTANQTFNPVSGTNIALSINSSGSIHTISAGITGNILKANSYANTFFTDQSNVVGTGVQDFSNATSLVLPRNTFGTTSTNGSTFYDNTSGTLRTGIGGLTRVIATSALPQSTANGFLATLDSAGRVAPLEAFSEATTPAYVFGKALFVNSGGASGAALYLETDQVILRGDTGRGVGTHMLAMKGITSQTGDFIRVSDAATNTIFRIRSNGQPSFNGVNYTMPPLPSGTECLQMTNAGVISTTGSACGSGGGGTATSFSAFAQTGHGLTALTPVYRSTTNTWNVAINTDQSKWATGLVISVADANNLTVMMSGGIYTVTSHGLDATKTYFLSDSGGVCVIGGAGCAAGNRQPILYAIDADRIQYFGILQNAGASSGTVTSVNIAMPAIFTVSGGPVTSSGTITAALATQAADLAFASPTGVSGAPVFRKLTTSDHNTTSLTGSGGRLATTVSVPADGCASWSGGNLTSIGSACGSGGGGGAPTTAQYVTLATDGTLTSERVLVGASNQISITDGGAGGNVTVGLTNTVRIGTAAGVGGVIQFANSTNSNVTGLTAGAPGSNISFTLPSSVPGSTQCLQMDASGVISATGSACGSGGGGGSWSSIGTSTANATIATSTFSTTFTHTTSLTNSVNNFFRLEEQSSGTVGVGMGTAIQMAAKTSTGAMQDLGRFQLRWQNHVDGSRTAEAAIGVTYSGSGGVAEQTPVVHRADLTQLNPFDTTAGSTHALGFYELVANGSNYTALKAPDALASNIVYTLPSSAPSSGTNYALNWTAGNVMSWTQFQLPITAVSPLALDGSNNLTCSTCVTQSSGFITLTASLFAALGTPANGTIVYCSDCTIASPCAGSGTGALAKRLNGIWVCN